MQELSQFVLKIAPIEGENLEWQRKCCNFAEVIGGRERGPLLTSPRGRNWWGEAVYKKNINLQKQKEDEQNL